MAKKRHYRSKEEILYAKKMEKVFKRSQDKVREYAQTDYTGRKVKLNMKSYESQIMNGIKLLDNFVEWLDENKEKEFIVAGKSKDSDAQYLLEGVEPWEFYMGSLTLVD